MYNNEQLSYLKMYNIPKGYISCLFKRGSPNLLSILSKYRNICGYNLRSKSHTFHFAIFNTEIHGG